MCTPLVQGTTDLLHSELWGEHAQILADRPKTSKDPDRQEMLLKYASGEYICPVIDCARPPPPISYVEALTLNGMVLAGGALWR